MAQTKKKVFDGLYAGLEETDGNVVLFQPMVSRPSSSR